MPEIASVFAALKSEAGGAVDVEHRAQTPDPATDQGQRLGTAGELVAEGLRDEEVPGPDRRVPDVSRVLEGVPPDLAHVVQRLVEKDPAKRYRTADEVLADLSVEGEAPPSLDDPNEEEAAAAEATNAKRKRSLVIAAASCSIVLSVAMLFLPNSSGTKNSGRDQETEQIAQQPGESLHLRRRNCLAVALLAFYGLVAEDEHMLYSRIGLRQKELLLEPL